MQPASDTWALPKGLPVKTLTGALARSFALDPAPEYRAAVTYADSFDWRLYRQGCLLRCHDRFWTLYHGQQGEVTLQKDGPELKTSCFPWEFPAGPLRGLLEPVLERRCLLPCARLILHERRINLRNHDGKTVARLSIESQYPEGGKPCQRLLRLFPVRGYEQEAESLRRILAEQGVSQKASPLSGFEEGCAALGRRPLDYNAKVLRPLHPEDTAGKAARSIHRQLLELMEVNLPGLLADLDIEFLHDFRVAVRRMRSAASLFKRVFPEAELRSLKKDCTLLGRLSGPTRDLDVHLLSGQETRSLLPEYLWPGADAFWEELAARRREEQRDLARALTGRKIRALFKRRHRFLEAEAGKMGPDAGLPIHSLAAQLVRRRCRRVLRQGQSLHAATSDEELHRLRIACKKLRYSLEFFTSLYPPQEMQALLHHLKKVQDALGTFNDLSIQQAWLQDYLGNPPPEWGKSGASPLIPAAVGALMQEMHQKRQGLRAQAMEAFRRFARCIREEHVILLRPPPSAQQESP